MPAKINTKLTLDPLTDERTRAEALRKFTFPRKKLRRDNEPFGLPKGSVRAIITLVAISGYTIAVMYSMIAGKNIPESLSSIVITIIAFYFGTRSAGKEVEGNEIEVMGEFQGNADNVSGNKIVT